METLMAPVIWPPEGRAGAYWQAEAWAEDDKLDLEESKSGLCLMNRDIETLEDDDVPEPAA